MGVLLACQSGISVSVFSDPMRQYQSAFHCFFVDPTIDQNVDTSEKCLTYSHIPTSTINMYAYHMLTTPYLWKYSITQNFTFFSWCNWCDQWNTHCLLSICFWMGLIMQSKGIHVPKLPHHLHLLPQIHVCTQWLGGVSSRFYHLPWCTPCWPDNPFQSILSYRCWFSELSQTPCAISRTAVSPGWMGLSTTLVSTH